MPIITFPSPICVLYIYRARAVNRTDNQLSNSNYLSTDKKFTRAVKIVVVIGVPIFMLALGLVLEIAIVISNLKDGSYLIVLGSPVKKLEKKP